MEFKFICCNQKLLLNVVHLNNFANISFEILISSAICKIWTEFSNEINNCH